MANLKLDYSQKMQQQLKLSPQMIQSIDLLRLPVEELCDRVYKEAEKNPAIEIVKDADLSIRTVTPSQTSRFSNASDNFQSFLENTADHEESLQEHLLFQLSLLNLSENERNLGERIIQNLDVHGFFSTSLEKILYPNETMASLNHVLEIIRTLEPQGIAFPSVNESLLYQAKQNGVCSPLVFEILQNHFSVLEKKRVNLIKKHLQDNSIDCTLEEVEDALACIKMLDPYPARNFNAVNSTVQYVIPDVIIRKRDENDDEDENTTEGFVVEFLKGSLPEITLSPVYTSIIDEKNKSKEAHHFALEAVQNAKLFIQSLEYRKNSMYQAIQEIVTTQYEFFRHGPGHLVPLRQKDVAKKIGMHETTISRIANGKYLQCDWGIFELKYFFTNAVHNKLDQDTENIPDSKEAIKHQIVLLLNESERAGEKKLSDSKIVKLLEEKGIHIARRTIAKYRSELNIESSFDRL